MSTPTESTPPPRPISPSTVALWVLFVGSAPVLLPVVVWMLHQPLIALSLLLFVAAWTWRPAHTKRALLVGAALVHQQVSQRRQSKTATA